MSIISTQAHFVTSFTKYPHISENMTMPCDFTKNTRWDILTTRNTLVNYSHHPLTHIAVQVLYTAIQSNLIPYKHRYLIYVLRKILRILKFGYPASKIVIDSGPSSHALIICVTSLSSQSLTIYGFPIKILESSVGTMKNTVNGYIDTFFLHTLDHGGAMNTTWTHQYTSTG